VREGSLAYYPERHHFYEKDAQINAMVVLVWFFIESSQREEVSDARPLTLIDYPTDKSRMLSAASKIMAYK
jgi:hypothetical protein